MAPSVITEDYYLILEVEQTAELELITRSYKRLALKLHPDRNPRRDATEAFQRLIRAYETLKDESERHKYDLIYPSLKGKDGSSQYTQEPCSGPVPTSQSGTASEAAQLAALQRSIQQRAARWRTNNMTFESSIFEIKREIRRLEQDIKGLDSILAAEVAAEAQKNSWSTWLLSPIYKKAEDSDEEKARKDRARQERRIEKDMKERRLDANKSRLKTTETLMRTLKAEIDAADSRDEVMIQNIQHKIWMRECRERQEKEQAEKAERDRKAQQMRQQQEQQRKKEREAAEVLRQEQAAKRAAEQKRYEDENRKWQEIIEEQARKRWEHSTFSTFAERSGPQTRTATCQHDGWWPKVQGRTVCPECYESWTYLLQCPGCAMKACPRCQAAVRPRRPRNATRTDRRVPPRIRTPSPDYDYDCHW